jgi:DNA polymerase
VRGSRRIAKTPLVSEIDACRPWLESELDTLQPELIVALGAVAARSLLGESVSIAEARGKFFQNDQGLNLIVTFHPSAALRHPLDDERKRIADALIDDLKMARQFLEDLSRPDLHPE